MEDITLLVSMATNQNHKMEGISLYRLNALLLFIILSTVILYFGRSFLIPLFFSLLFAMLLLPLCRKLEYWGLSRVLSTLVGALLIILFMLFIISIIAGQSVALVKDLPEMRQKANESLANLQQWIHGQFGFAPEDQFAYLKKGLESLSESGISIVNNIFPFLAGFVLVVVYFFFIMWKREKYVEFILKLVKKENRITVGNELKQIRKVAGQYLIGRMISMLFLVIVYCIAFSAIGLPNSVLLAFIAVIPTIVPYIGAFVGGFFPVAVALMAGPPGVFWVTFVILILAQVIDNNFIEPLVQGESLHISPVFTIIALVMGGLVWGISGMILFMPLFAIFKIVCDRIPALHPYGFLLSNEVREVKWIKALRTIIKRL